MCTRCLSLDIPQYLAVLGRPLSLLYYVNLGKLMWINQREGGALPLPCCCRSLWFAFPGFPGVSGGLLYTSKLVPASVKYVSSVSWNKDSESISRVLPFQTTERRAIRIFHS
jgi:hypothetical protein